VPVLVPGDRLTAVTEAWLDRVADAAARLGTPPAQVAGVVARSGLALVEACASSPERVGDLVGRWFADTRAVVTALRAVDPASPPAPSPPGPRRGRSPDPDPASFESALAGLDERRRFALLLRDSYALPAPAVAVALRLPPSSAALVVAEARLRLSERVGGGPAPSLAGHREVPGLTLAVLGGLADGSVAEAEPRLPALRQHVAGCARCAEILDVQSRVRAALGTLPVRALGEEERASVLARIAERTRVALPPVPVDAPFEPPVPARRISPAAVVTALLLALLGGAATGALTASGPTETAAPGFTPDSVTPEAPDGGAPGSGALPPAVNPAVNPVPSPAAPPPGSSPPPAPAPTAVSPTPVTATTTGRATTTPAPTPAPAQRTPTGPASGPAAPSTGSSAPTAAPARLALVPASGPSGSTVTAEGTGFTPGSTALVTFQNATGGASRRTPVDARGGFAVTLTVPLTSTPGRHEVIADDGSRSASATFTQTA